MFVRIRITIKSMTSGSSNSVIKNHNSNDFFEATITETNLLKLYAERDKQNIPINLEILDERPLEDDWSNISYFIEKRTHAKFK